MFLSIRMPQGARRTASRRSANGRLVALRCLASGMLALAFSLLAGQSAMAAVFVGFPEGGRVADYFCADDTTGEKVACPDYQEYYYAARMRVLEAYWNSEFDTLESLFTRFCSGKERFADGTWYLAQFAEAFDFHLGNTRWSSKELDKIRRWQQAVPGSVAARYAEAIYWRGAAWKARGNGYASSVPPEGWKLFRERIGNARDLLDGIGERNFSCAAPYPLLLNLMVDSGASDEDLRATFLRAVKRFPEYHKIYLSMARHFTPKWGGSEAAFEAFALESAQRTRAFEGMGMYSRIHAYFDNPSDIPFRGDQGRLSSWEQLKAGFEDLMQRYPANVSIAAAYADAACRTSDSALYRRLRPRLAGHEASLKLNQSLDVCDERHQWRPLPDAARAPVKPGAAF